MVHAFERFEVERLSLAAALALALAGVSEAQNPAQSPREDWPTYGGSFSHQRFSLLRQVTTKNVGRLRVEWTFPIPDAGTGNTSLQTTPLVVRGSDAGMPALDAVMLITSPNGRVLALDAARGQRLW
jgi:quinoprotein glucose dehydrogenase